MPGFAEIIVSLLVFAVLFGINKIRHISISLDKKGKDNDK